MKTARALMLVAAGLLPAPALACTMVWTPLGERMTRLLPGKIVVRADASIVHDIWSDDHRRGTLRLNVHRCLRASPKGVACPEGVTVTFDERWDGVACPSAVYEISAAEAPRLRYFQLWHQPDGTWTVRSADRHMWRR